MRYDFDKPFERKGTFSNKWDGAYLFADLGLIDKISERTICAWVADMDFLGPESIREEIQKVVDRNSYGYSSIAKSSPATKPYYDAVIGWFQRRHNWTIDPADLFYSKGTVNAIEQSILALTTPEDSVLITPPVYGPFSYTVAKTGRTLVNSPLVEREGHYEIDFSDFEAKAADPHVKVFVLCNPHNPVGRIWNEEELRRLYDICVRHDVVVVADEIHGDLIRRDQVFHPLATLVDGKNLISLTAANKTFNIADLECTNVVITDPALKEAVSPRLMANPNAITIAATIGAYNGGEEWLEQLKEYLDKTIDWVLDFTREHMPRLKIARPEGTYILWMDFRGYGLTPDEVNDRIANRAEVLLERGEMFGQEGAGFQRICIPTQLSRIQEIFHRFEEVFER